MYVILGPTATGKTHFASYLANKINAEIISADSRQVYRGMTIGTGKDYRDYIVDNQTIPCHLIDIVDPGYEYNIFEFKRDFTAAYKDITERGKEVILCGGSGMYIEAVLADYRLDEVPKNIILRNQLADRSDAELADMLLEIKGKTNKKLHNHTDLDTRERMLRAIEIETFFEEHDENEDKRVVPEAIIGLCAEREFVRQKITNRLRTRLEDEDMIGEVQKLLDSGVDSERLKRYGLEYKFITMYVLGEISYDTMFDRLNIAIHQFSKRQMTWFRRMEKKGFEIIWVDATLSDDEKIDFLAQNGLKFESRISCS
ncbi:MAG: tRNA (adenosine(37)-N6)-dimethylallyltransferase MiaA [Bacteroidales bacterium]|nr:tRNA (adenosine(37)-N6)-dimethylallyltransferase MiaA [Bacteroidales bacterium]